MKFICNKDRNAYEIEGIVVKNRSAVQLKDGQEDAIKANPLGKELLRKGLLYFADEYPKEFKTTGQQLTDALTASEDAQKEIATLKQEALDEIAKRDLEIEELKAKLAALSNKEE